jgi:hypothetical protein
MRTFGAVLVVVGAVGVFGALRMNTSVETPDGTSRVHNIGLLADRQNALILSGLVAIAGLGFVGFGSAKKGASASEDEQSNKTCPFCAEQIKSAAVVCRFCNRELPTAVN